MMYVIIHINNQKQITSRSRDYYNANEQQRRLYLKEFEGGWAMGRANKKPMGKRKKIIITATVLIVLAALNFWAFFNGIVIEKYEIESDKINEDSSVRIVAIADLHSHIYGEEQQILIEKIKAQKPDVIALVGDIVDDNGDMRGAELLLAGIVDIAPAYFVTGNHEIRTGEVQKIKKVFDSYGVIVLENEYSDVRINGIDLRICGIEDPEIYESANNQQRTSEDEMLARFKGLDDSRVNILLAHRPERIEAYKQYNFDVVLSGHAHGGQIRILLLVNGIFAPDQGFFPKYAGGLYEHGGLSHIVSRGFAYNPNLPRIFNPPEVVVVDIKAK